MKLQLGVVTVTPSLATEAILRALAHADGPVEPLLYENACSVPAVVAQRITSDVNVGVTAGLHGIYSLSDPDPSSILVYMHDDVRIDEQGWDKRVLSAFENPKVGLVGFGGACRLSRTAQRGPFFSNMEDAEKHGARVTRDFSCVAIDGFGFAVRRAFLDQLGGWSSWWPYPHHGYDFGISCQAKRLKWSVRATPIACAHEGSRTARQALYQDGIARDHGGDLNLLRTAYRHLSKVFARELPLQCPNPI